MAIRFGQLTDQMTGVMGGRIGKEKLVGRGVSKVLMGRTCVEKMKVTQATAAIWKRQAERGSWEKQE